MPSHLIHVSEGIDEEGQLYVRREWASSKFGLVEMQVPDDFISQGWGPAYVPESSDTLEDVHAHFDQLVEDSILTLDEQARSALSSSVYSTRLQGQPRVVPKPPIPPQSVHTKFSTTYALQLLSHRNVFHNIRSDTQSSGASSSSCGCNCFSATTFDCCPLK